MFDPPHYDDPTDDEPVLIKLKNIRLQRLRDFGDVWLALGLWRLLGLDTLLVRLMPEGRVYPDLSGTDPNNSLLQAWVVDRDEEDVPRVDQDNNHGSFVAGLIINGRRLNHDDTRFPLAQAKIVDIVGLPKPDTPVDEADLLRTISRK